MTGSNAVGTQTYCWYVHGLPGSAELRDIANNSTDAEKVFAAVDQFLLRCGLRRRNHHHPVHMADQRFLADSLILAALPNPVCFDVENRFVYLNQAAEIFSI